jgi:hypothetical protein
LESLVRVSLPKKKVERLKKRGMDLSAAAAAIRRYSNTVGVEAKAAEKDICARLNFGPLYD